MNSVTPARCIVMLGGSFDPVHNGHVALAEHVTQCLQPDELRLIPAGDPWQKPPLHATAAERVRMLDLAFAATALPYVIDEQEILRCSPSYTIDTLRALRAQVGPEAALIFVIGADQLQQLHTWREWRSLLDFAHLCAVSRPGYSLQNADLQTEVQQVFMQRLATPQQLCRQAHGFTYLDTSLSFNISSSAVRAALQQEKPVNALVPPQVLDYIHRHKLYKS